MELVCERYFFTFILFFATFCFVNANEPVVLKYADQLIGEQTGGSNKRTLLGNVQLQQGNVFVKCNSAIQYLNTNRFQLSGNVVITQDSLTLNAENILYDGNNYMATTNEKVEIKTENKRLIGGSGNYSTKTLIANFKKDIVLENDSLIIFADSIKYDRKTENSFAFGNVKLKNKFKKIFLTCDELEHFPQNNLTIANKNAILYSIDSNDNDNDSSDNAEVNNEKVVDTSYIKADSIVSIGDKEDEEYNFYYNVEFINYQIKSKSNFAKYVTNVENILLSTDSLEQCIIWLDSTQLFADSISINLKDNKLQNIYAFYNCFALSKSDSSNLDRIDQLQGDTMIFYLRDDTLHKIESIGNAKSVFFSTTDQQSDGVIESSAKQIIIYIFEGKPNEIELVSQVSGKYYPEPIIDQKWKDYYLTTFRISDKQPIKPTISD